MAGSEASGGAEGTGASTGSGLSLLDALVNPVPVAKADSVQSGSRLKAVYWVGADGSKQPFLNQWYDSQRRENCSFTILSDGNYHCRPASPAFVLGYFADAGCTQQLAQASSAPGCTAPTTAVVSPASASCPTKGERVYQVGAVFTGTVYSGTPSSCTKSTTPSGYALYNVGAEIPASSFVSATVQTDQ